MTHLIISTHPIISTSLGGAYGRQASPPRSQGGRQTAATIAAAAAAAAADKIAEGVDGTLSIVIPDHIFLDKTQLFWIPVDRALRVMQVSSLFLS